MKVVDAGGWKWGMYLDIQVVDLFVRYVSNDDNFRIYPMCNLDVMYVPKKAVGLSLTLPCLKLTVGIHTKLARKVLKGLGILAVCVGLTMVGQASYMSLI